MVIREALQSSALYPQRIETITWEGIRLVPPGGEASRTEAAMAHSSQSTRSCDANGKLLSRLNQNIVLGGEPIDLRASLHAYASQSRWVTLILWSVWMQILGSGVVLLPFQSLLDAGSPVSLVGSLIHSIPSQLVNTFVGILLGTYVDDERTSKLLFAILSTPLWILAVWDVSTPFLGIWIAAKGIILAPLILVAWFVGFSHYVASSKWTRLGDFKQFKFHKNILPTTGPSISG